MGTENRLVFVAYILIKFSKTKQKTNIISLNTIYKYILIQLEQNTNTQKYYPNIIQITHTHTKYVACKLISILDYAPFIEKRKTYNCLFITESDINTNIFSILCNIANSKKKKKNTQLQLKPATNILTKNTTHSMTLTYSYIY